MTHPQPIVICWFRRDLRLSDNHALHRALASGLPVLPLFIFDSNILGLLENPADARVSFIYRQLKILNEQLQPHNTSIRVMSGKPEQVWQKIFDEYNVVKVFLNRDYEPYAIDRDRLVEQLAVTNGASFTICSDQLIREPEALLKKDGTPYTVFTPYKNKWLELLTPEHLKPHTIILEQGRFVRHEQALPPLTVFGFEASIIQIPDADFDAGTIAKYEAMRDLPAKDATTHAGPHLRFGTISIRQVVSIAKESSTVYLSELIWREFFTHILFHFPRVVSGAFRTKYNRMQWRNNEAEFALWCSGQTGYPLVDAGMRQLLATGFMHNRVRMVTAGFLCKHLLIDWRWGEAWFASHLLDFELASNNGNWQWAAGTGCDAAPYFRVFNPATQNKKFDPDNEYVRRWLPEWGTGAYPVPMVDHKEARLRALAAYRKVRSEE